jgi:hypothetical protein
MLQIPTKGISRSVTTHNVELDVFCDWIEGSILFIDDKLSSTDIVDALTEDQIYDDQDMAAEMVANAWTELKRRALCVGDGVSFSISGSRITRQYPSWRDTPAHSFCVLLSLAKWHREWAQQFGSDYTEQGALFEYLTKETLERLFSGWIVHATGWTRTRTNGLAAVVDTVASHLGESKGKVERWTRPTAKEAGLDLLCYRPFTDKRVGVPVYLMQCASGSDWVGKLHTPSLRIWTKVVEFTTEPKKAFATPFAFLEDDFRINCNLVDGLLLDRYRLLSVVGSEEEWVSDSLKERIIAWCEPRVAELPSRDV